MKPTMSVALATTKKNAVPIVIVVALVVTAGAVENGVLAPARRQQQIDGLRHQQHKQRLSWLQSYQPIFAWDYGTAEPTTSVAGRRFHGASFKLAEIMLQAACGRLSDANKRLVENQLRGVITAELSRQLDDLPRGFTDELIPQEDMVEIYRVYSAQPEAVAKRFQQKFNDHMVQRLKAARSSKPST